jgi:hypothetical protein
MAGATPRSHSREVVEMLKRLLVCALILIPTVVLAGSILTLHVGLAPTSTLNLVTPVFSNFSALTGTANHFGFVVAGQTAAVGTTNGAFPMPFAGKVGNLSASLNNATTLGTSSIVDQVNGVSKTVTCTFSTAQCVPAGTPSDTFNQGDFVQWEGVIGSGDSWSQTATGRIGFTITAASGQHAPLFSVASGATTTTPSFSTVGSNNSNVATELSVSGISPTGYTVVGAWGKALSTEGAVGHTITVCQNNSVATCTAGTGIFFTTVPSSAVGGCGTTAASGVLQGGSGCAQVNLTGMHFAVGDTISIKDTCASTCSNTVILVTLDIIPDNTGEVPVFAQAASIGTNSSVWAGVSDMNFLNASGQVAYQVVPNVTGQVTLSKMIACTAVNPGGAATRPFTLQSGANPTTLPTTGSGPVATLSVANGACPGANSATLLAGNQPATTLALTAGQTLDTVTTGVGSPASPGVTKVSYVAVVGPG